MRYLKKIGLILFIIGLMAFCVFLGVRFASQDKDQENTKSSRSFSEQVSNIVTEAEEDVQKMFKGEKGTKTPPQKSTNEKRKFEKFNDKGLDKEAIYFGNLVGTTQPEEQEAPIDEDMLSSQEDTIELLDEDITADEEDNKAQKPSPETKEAEKNIASKSPLSIDTTDTNKDLNNNKDKNVAFDPEEDISLDDVNDAASENNNPSNQSETKTDETKKNKSSIKLTPIEVVDVDKELQKLEEEQDTAFNPEDDISLDDVNDKPFDEGEVMDEKTLYNLVNTEDPAADKKDQDTDFIQNAPEFLSDEATSDAGKDIFGEDDIVFPETDIVDTESNKKTNQNDIFSSPSPAIVPEKNTAPAEKASEPPSEDSVKIDDDILAQIDTPDDLYMPDERRIGKTPIMTEPNKKISEEEQQALFDSLFPSEEEAAKGKSLSDIAETNKALAPKNVTDIDDKTNKDNGDTQGTKEDDDDDFLGLGSLFDDLTADAKEDKDTEDDVTDLDIGDINDGDAVQADTQKGEMPLTADTDPNLSKPSLMKNKKDMSPEEKIAVTPFTTVQAGTATCRFEHVIDAHQMSEQFRLTVMPPNGATPLKMETIQDLSLDKFLTMKMDEVDGYPDQFSSLAVFCKDMTISKRLIESY